MLGFSRSLSGRLEKGTIGCELLSGELTLLSFFGDLPFLYDVASFHV
jgi:hypothetical protein